MNEKERGDVTTTVTRREEKKRKKKNKRGEWGMYVFFRVGGNMGGGEVRSFGWGRYTSDAQHNTITLK